MGLLNDYSRKKIKRKSLIRANVFETKTLSRPKTPQGFKIVYILIQLEFIAQTKRPEGL